VIRPFQLGEINVLTWNVLNGRIRRLAEREGVACIGNHTARDGHDDASRVAFDGNRMIWTWKSADHDRADRRSVRGVGSEFVLACDMRFAARESAIFGQFEPAFGVIPGAGGAQHLACLMGRARALEVMLRAEDYDAELAR